MANKNDVVSADDANVTPLLAFFEKKFRWMPGEYEVVLRIQTEPPNAMPDKHFRITLFESDSKEMEDYRSDYKYGFGVSLILPKHAGVFVPLSEA